MGKYFENINTLEDLRKQYKDLLKKHHPDNGKRVEITPVQTSAGTLRRTMPKRNWYPCIQSSRHQFQNRELVGLNINVLLH